MPLAEPPAELAGLVPFPHTQLRGEVLHRIFRDRDPRTGRVRGPFYFASADDAGGGGRYDLPPPNGSCYLAREKIGAWLEKFRSTYVALDDLRAHRMLTTRAPYSLRAADLLAAAARGFGVTGDIHTTTDYALTRQWASRLHQVGFRALHGKVRHDPGLEHRSVTLFDQQGQRMPYGWRWRTEVGRLEEDRDLLRQAGRYGYRGLAVPFDVAVRRPESVT